jgi:hypothetical protein
MTDYVYVVGIVAVVAITAIVFGRTFGGRAGPGGGELVVGGTELSPTEARGERAKRNGYRRCTRTDVGPEVTGSR